MCERPRNLNLLESDVFCIQCDDDRQSVVLLDCRHPFCMICLGYLVLKQRITRQDESEVPCSYCKKITKLNGRILQAIELTIREFINDRLNSIEQTCQMSSADLEQSMDQSQRISEFSLKKQRKQPCGEKPAMLSQEQSIDHITPSTRYLHSKGDSPVSSLPIKQCCMDHPLEECSFVCLTCPTKLLCVKCMSQPLHHNHVIKSLEKGMELLSDQLNFRKIEVNQRIDLLETRKRRLQGKKGLLQDKCNKSKMQITEQVKHLINRLKKRELELLQDCQSCYRQLEQQINDQLDSISKRLFGLRKFKYDFKKLQTIETDGQPEQALEFFGLFNRLRNELEGALADSPSKPRPKPLSFIAEPEIQLNEKELAEAVESIKRINLTNINTPHIQGTCSVATPMNVPGFLTNACVSLSTSKMGNIVTQFTSMNTSTEKKKVKHLRTEDNENLRLQTDQMKSAGKLRTNINSRFNSPQNRFGETPHYITKFFEKHTNNGRGEQASEYNYASKVSIPNLDGSSFVDNDASRNKFTTKQTRVQRKTTNPLHSLQTQKQIFDNKKSKLK